MNKNLNECLFVGSFDPWQTGHQERLENALKIFDKVHIIIATNEDKTNFWFNHQERIELIKKCVSQYQERVTIKTYQNKMLYEICKEENIYKIFRGVKGGRTLDEEIRLQKFTRYMSSKLYQKDILFIYDITGDDDFKGSSIIKKLALKNEPFEDLVPTPIVSDIKQRAIELKNNH